MTPGPCNLPPKWPDRSKEDVRPLTIDVGTRRDPHRPGEGEKRPRLRPYGVMGEPRVVGCGFRKLNPMTLRSMVMRGGKGPERRESRLHQIRWSESEPCTSCIYLSIYMHTYACLISHIHTYMILYILQIYTILACSLAYKLHTTDLYTYTAS